MPRKSSSSSTNRLKNCIISSTGDFGEGNGTANVKKWVEVNGGIYVEKVDGKTTHLICSRTDYVARVRVVKDALKHKKLKIVTFEWLEDSIGEGKTRKRVEKYLLASTERKAKKEESRKEKDSQKGAIEQFHLGCDEFSSKMASEGYSIFQDSTGFAYDIILTRTDEVLEKDEKYTLKVGVPILPYVRINRTRVPLPRPLAQRLQLYATGEEPRVHACYMTYSAPIYGSKTETVAPLASTFSTAVGAFKRMFRLKTQKDWDARLKDDKYEFTAFRYDVPMKGPIGLIPLDPKEPVAPATASEQITDADNLEGIAAETFEGFADPILGLEEMNQDEDMEGVTSSAAAESKHDAPVDDYLEPSSKDYYLPEPFTDAFGRPMEFDITKIMKRHGGEDDADKATGDGEKDEREEKAPGDGEGSDAEEGVIGDEHQ